MKLLNRFSLILSSRNDSEALQLHTPRSLHVPDCLSHTSLNTIIVGSSCKMWWVFEQILPAENQS